MDTQNTSSEVMKNALKELTRVRECLHVFSKELDVEKQDMLDKLHAIKEIESHPGDQEIGRGHLVQVIKQQTDKLSSSLDNVRLSNSNIAASLEKELSDLLARNSKQKQRIIDFSIQLQNDDDDVFESSGDTTPAVESRMNGGDFNDHHVLQTANSSFSID